MEDEESEGIYMEHNEKGKNKNGAAAGTIIGILIIAFIAGILYSRIERTERTQGDNGEEIVTVHIGRLSLVKFDEMMYYDEDTKVVYLWNGCCTGHTNYDTVPVPYLAENDKPFHYNEGTGHLETAP